MAKAQQSLLKNSSSIESIKDSLNAFGVSLRKANSTSSGIVKSLYQGNRDKKNAILKQRELFQKRREAVQKREQEDIVEAGKVGSVYRRSSKVISGSTKGFLGRVMDFVGTIMVGWLVNNLPRIIKGAEQLIGRIQDTIETLSSWVDSIGNFFSDFSGQLGNVLGTNKNLYIDKDKTDADASVKQVETGVNKMIQDMNNMVSSLTGFDLAEYLGLTTPGLDSSSLPSSDSPSEGGGTYGDSGSGSSSSSSSSSGASSGVGTKEQRAMLDAISFAEGTKRSYGTVFGGKVIPELERGEMTVAQVLEMQKTGTFNGIQYIPPNSYDSDATGRYQFMSYTLKEEVQKQKVPMDAKFTPALQDKLILGRIARFRGVTADLLKKEGMSTRVMDMLAPEFASFPYSPKGNRSYYGQPVKSPSSIRAAYQKSLGSQSSQTRQTTQTTQPSGPAPSINSSIRYAKNQNISKLLGATAVVTSKKGWRWGRMHSGIDIGCDSGVYISLRVDAEVDGYLYNGGYGHVVDLWVPSLKVQLRFAHNTKVLIKAAGTKIPAGTSFAITGSTGRSTGPHIHFEVDSRKGRTGYNSNMIPDPYVPLIRLTSTAIRGSGSSDNIVKKITGLGGPDLNIERIQSQTGVSEKVTPSREGKTITVPMPMGGETQQPASAPQGGGGSSISLGGGDQLNNFVNKTLLRELEYT